MSHKRAHSMNVVIFGTWPRSWGHCGNSRDRDWGSVYVLCMYSRNRIQLQGWRIFSYLGLVCMYSTQNATPWLEDLVCNAMCVCIRNCVFPRIHLLDRRILFVLYLFIYVAFFIMLTGYSIFVTQKVFCPVQWKNMFSICPFFFCITQMQDTAWHVIPHLPKIFGYILLSALNNDFHGNPSFNLMQSMFN